VPLFQLKLSQLRTEAGYFRGVARNMKTTHLRQENCEPPQSLIGRVLLSWRAPVSQ